MNKNFDKLQNYLGEPKIMPEIIALTETKISMKSTKSINYDLPNYSFVYKETSTCFGGVGFYIANNLSYKLRNDLDFTYSDCECIFIQIEDQDTKKRTSL